MFLEHFELADSEVGGELSRDATWVPAVVPGGVHEALLQAGRIPHPYLDQHERDITWIEQRDWWYRTAFEGPTDLAADERVRLVFHGLDTVVDVTLNGEHLASHENMFRPLVVDVTQLLRPRNELVLRFTPPLHGLGVADAPREMLQRLMAVMGASLTEEGDEGGGSSFEVMPIACQRRKAAFSWGWDFGPRVPSVGIWRPVELRRERRGVLSSHFVSTEQVDREAGTATVRLSVEAEVWASRGAPSARMVLAPADGQPTMVVVPLTVDDGTARGEALVTVDDARLWWTNDLGEAHLYQVTTTLFDGEDEVDELVDRVGLRTISLHQAEDPEGGNLFRFVLNGVPLFARGANWLPASLMVGSVAPETYRMLIQRAHDAGMNMIRIWGGGIYEHQAFYQACDELGVLVWQDFMFAVIDYPSADPHLQDEVRAEAEYQVKRLRNHPSIGLWCGNNEVQALHGYAYQNYEPGDWGWHFFHDILPTAVAEFAGKVPYWPGCPWGVAEAEGFMAVNGQLDGDRHAWEVWHGLDYAMDPSRFASIGHARHFRRYAEDRGKFISEFGIHASPELSTLRTWMTSDGLALHDSDFQHRNKDHPKNKHNAVLEIVTGLPTTLEEYADFTMVSQAEGLKFGIEHYRRRQPHCSGTLVWQLNDVWPGFSWSVIDHHGVGKAGYHYLRRVYSPTLASFRDGDDDTLELWVTHNGLEPVATRCVVTVETFAGDVTRRDELDVEVSPGGSQMVWSIPRVGVGDPTTHLLRVTTDDGAFPANRLFLAEVKDLQFGAARLDWTVEPTGVGTASITIASRGYSYLVRVLSPTPGVSFSDNYLDLRDGQSVRIEVSGLPEGFDLAEFDVGGYAGQQVTSVRG